jgi:hydrogenase maturation protein HypF
LLEDPALDYLLGITPSPPHASTAPNAPATPSMSCLDPTPMWLALLGDLARGTPAPLMAARFHRGLARSLARLAVQLAHTHRTSTVALGGGVFQNRHLSELLLQALRAEGLTALLPREVPCNDGGLAWGQALVALARAA